MRLKLMRLLVASSIVVSPRRFASMMSLMTAVTTVVCAALVIAASGSAEFRRAVEESGALEYEVAAQDRDTGSSVEVSLSTIEDLASSAGIQGLDFIADVHHPLETDEIDTYGIEPAVLAMSADATPLMQANYLAGIAPSAMSDSSASVVVGWRAAAASGFTKDCFAAYACNINVAGERTVTAVVDFEDDALDTAIVLDYDAALEQGLAGGPKLVNVRSRALPAEAVRRSIDAIASSSASDQTISVSAPTVAASLREGFGNTWRGTIGAVSIAILILANLAQYTNQASVLRSRTSEVGTLRSLGCSIRFMVAHLVAEPALAAVLGTLLGVVISFVASELFASALGTTGLSSLVGPALILSGISCLSSLTTVLYPAARLAYQDPGTLLQPQD